MTVIPNNIIAVAMAMKATKTNQKLIGLSARLMPFDHTPPISPL